MEKRIEVIVTRHQGLVDYLEEIGMADASTKVVAHASPEHVRGRHVCGVLPHSLSCLCKFFTEVPLSLPPELRGEDLSLEKVRQYAGEPVTYKIERIL